MAKAAVKKKSSSAGWTLENFLPWLLFVGGAIALLAMIILSVEVFDRLKNPHFVPVCNLNPILNCSNVADSNQAHAFGIPNYFIAMPGFSIISTVGVIMLAGAKMKRWFWRLFEAGMLFAAAFVTWLQFETLYRIGSLCLFCMVGWACMIPIFWYTTLYNFQKGHLPTPTWLRRPLAFIRRHHADILIVWFLIIIALILKRFWYYWSTLI